jgi:hypothetical protein
MPANYVLIGEQTTSVNTASVTFSNIPQTGYTDLKVVASVRNTTATTTGNVNFQVQINSLTTGYTGKWLYGTTSIGSTNANNTGIGTLTSANDTANAFSSVEIYLPNYTSSNVKTYSVESVSDTNSTTIYELDMLAKLQSTTSPITSLTFLCASDSLAAGSTFSLYGIAAFGTTPTVLPKATGGDIVVNDGTYWIHTFFSSGVFTPLSNLSCDYLVVAGGAGGGVDTFSGANRGGGGGGAGGLRSTVTATGGGGALESALSLTANTPVAVTIGAGGAGSAAGQNTGVSGSNSAFATITSTGGGGGGGHPSGNNFQGLSGGSGGGSANNFVSGGSASPSGQGFAGGGGAFDPQYNGGGGGGAGAAGVTGTASAAGAGGAGVATTISGSSTTYAGGGGGRGGSGDAAGGAGGGGAGGGISGTVNTGGGGGAARNSTAGSGGSGIVIVRYTMA